MDEAGAGVDVQTAVACSYHQHAGVWQVGGISDPSGPATLALRQRLCSQSYL